jgi:hypothetical protein
MDTILLVIIINNSYKKMITHIESLNKQTYSNWKLHILCIDDIFIDDFNKLKQIFKESDKISFINYINKSYSIAFNNSIKLVFKNEFSHFMIITDNDKYYPDFLKIIHLANKQFIYGNYHTHDNSNISIEYDKETIINKYSGLCSAMWSKKALEQIGFFNKKKGNSALFDYHIRTFNVIKKDKIGYIKKPLYYCKCKVSHETYGIYYLERWLYNNNQHICNYVKHLNDLLLEKKNQKEFFNSIYESSLSPNYIHKPNHNAYNNNKINNECNFIEDKKCKIKLITFILCIKNRNMRANICLQNLLDVTSKYKDIIEIIIVEEIGHDVFIDKFDILNNDNVYHIKLKEHDINIFNRSHLLNIGMKNAQTKYVVMYDCDFLAFNLDKLFSTLIYYKDRNDLIFRSSLYESENITRQKLEPYSYVWIYNKYIANKINYFNEDFKNWGFEETDMATRILNNDNKLIHIFNDFFHLSHNELTRNKNNIHENKTIFKNNITIPNNLELIKYNVFSGEYLLILNYNETNDIFNDEEAIIYTPHSLNVLLINKELFKCKIVGNIIDIPFSYEIYNYYRKVLIIGLDNLPIWYNNTNNIGIITPMYNQEIDVYKKCLTSIKIQENTNYIHIIVDSHSYSELLYSFFEINNPQSIFVKKKSKIVQAIKIGYKLISQSTIYWLWLNSDDEFYNKHTLINIKNIIEYNNNSDVIYGNSLLIKQNKKTIYNGKDHGKNPILSFLTQVGIAQPSAYIKSNKPEIEKSLFSLDESYVFDYELWIKLAFLNQKFKFIDICLSKYNFTNINITGNNRETQLLQTCLMIKKYYGFVPIQWLKKYKICKTKNIDGIWDKSIKSLSEEDIIDVIDFFNHDAKLTPQVDMNDYVKDVFLRSCNR